MEELDLDLSVPAEAEGGLGQYQSRNACGKEGADELDGVCRLLHLSNERDPDEL